MIERERANMGGIARVRETETGRGDRGRPPRVPRVGESKLVECHLALSLPPIFIYPENKRK